MKRTVVVLSVLLLAAVAAVYAQTTLSSIYTAGQWCSTTANGGGLSCLASTDNGGHIAISNLNSSVYVPMFSVYDGAPFYALVFSVPFTPTSGTSGTISGSFSGTYPDGTPVSGSTEQFVSYIAHRISCGRTCYKIRYDPIITGGTTKIN